MKKSRMRREHVKKCLALILTVCMVLQSGINSAIAASDGAGYMQGGLALEDGRCIHHPEHTAECGYRECNHVHTDECYETYRHVLSDEELASLSDAELASASDAELASASNAEPGKASPSDTEQRTATSSDAEPAEEDADGSEYDETEIGETDLINDVYEERVLDCRHKHDQNCGGSDCTFVCPYGCRYTGEMPMEEPVLTLKEDAVLIAGEEYSEEELIGLVERVEITNAVSNETDEGGLESVASVTAEEPEEAVVWETKEDTGFSFFGLRKAHSKAKTAFVPETEAGSYTVTYRLQDADSLEIKTASVNLPVVTSLDVANVTITAPLSYLYVGVAQNLLEGVLVTPAVTAENEPILLKVENVRRYKADGSEDTDFKWELTKDEDGTMQPLVTPDTVGSRYEITYWAYIESEPGTYVELVQSLSVAGSEEIGEMLVGDQAMISDAGMVADTRTTSKQAIKTGTTPFDDIDDKDNYEDPETMKIPKPGIDFGDYNDTMRSFDSLNYTVHFSTAMHKGQNTSPGFREGRLYFEFILPAEKEKAEFSTDSMGWLETRKEIKYVIEERQVPTEDGKMVSGQVLRGSFILEPAGDNPTAIGGSYNELNLAVQVLAMHSGDNMKPRFTFWLDGNDVGTEENDDHVPVGDLVTGSRHVCKEHGIQEYQTIEPAGVTVTAAPWYNVQIKKASAVATQIQGMFDFGTGAETAPFNQSGRNNVEGQLNCYGITLMIAGKTGQGLRGTEVPDGNPITFDINLSSKFTKDGVVDGVDVTQEYMPMFWSLQGNRENRTKEDGRYIPDRATGCYASVAAPLNAYTSGQTYSIQRCYNGGIWTYEWNEENPTVLHVKVEDYEVNLNKLPYTNIGESNPDVYYYNPNDVGDAYWKIDKACFSAGELWVVQSFMDKEGNRITDQYPDKPGASAANGSGTFHTTVSAGNLQVRSTSGQQLPEVSDNSNQSIRTDDSVVQSVYVDRAGDIVQAVRYLKYKKYAPSSDNSLTAGCDSNGYDWAAAGQGANIRTGISYSNAEGMHVSVAYDILLKFDDVFFVPEKITNSSCGDGDTGEGTILWAAKKDGTGWNHKGLKPDDPEYDREMKRAKVDDLVYYDSLEALRADGKVCVGALGEFRKTVVRSLVQPYFSVEGHISPEVEPRYVYMTTHSSRTWTKQTIKDYVQSDPARFAGLKDINSWTDDDYTDFVKNTEYFPSHRDSKVTYENSSYPKPFWINEWDQAGHKALDTYTKTAYDGNGGVLAEDTGSYKFGDSCLVVGFNTKIQLSVAQKNNSGGSKNQYDMDINQRVVDYVLSPSVERYNDDGNTEGATLTDTFYIEATIPESLTYIEGTSWWHDDSNCPYQANSDPSEPGESKGENIIENSPEKESVPWKSVTASPDGNGNTVLKWTLGNVTFDAAKNISLGHIHFSCRIGTPDEETTDVVNQQAVDSEAKIWSNLDVRKIDTANGNLSAYGFHITKNNAISISKIADDLIVELGSPMGFTMNIGNNSVNPMQDTYIIDRLPNHSDGESAFDGGKLIVDSLRVGTKKDDDYDTVMGGFKFYYTTNEEYKDVDDEKLRAMLAEAGTTIDNSDDWHSLTVKKESEGEENKDLLKGVIQDLPSEEEQKNEPIVAIVAYGDLPAQKTLKMHMTTDIDGGKPGDYVVNHLFRGKNESRAKSSIVQRVLQGVTWLDDDKDGLRTTNESQIGDITVTLMKLKKGGKAEDWKDYEPYTYTVEKDGKKELITARVKTGEKMDLLTGAIDEYDGEQKAGTVNGGYQFCNLPEGTFGVEFTDSLEKDKDGKLLVDLEDYKASPVKQGNNATIDSDGVPVYHDANDKVTEDAVNGHLESTHITDIVMPQVKQISNRIYSSSYHDSGFYGPRARLRVAKWIDNWDKYKTTWEKNDLVNDEFIVTVTDRNDFSTGAALNHAGNASGKFVREKASGYIEVYPGKNGTEYEIDEIIPKEYKKAGQFLTEILADNSLVDLAGNTVTVKPGEERVVIVHNVFEHSNYFHDDDSARNVFEGNRTPQDSGQGQSKAVDLTALLPEWLTGRQKQSDEEEKQAGGGLR